MNQRFGFSLQSLGSSLTIPSPPSPKIEDRALRNSFDEIPLRYNTGIRLSTLGTRRRYRGRTWLEKHCSCSFSFRSSTRGCRIANGPIPVRMFRSGMVPLRTSSRRPFSSRFAAWASMYSATSFSISRACCSNLRAPYRARASRSDRISPLTPSVVIDCSTSTSSSRLNEVDLFYRRICSFLSSIHNF
jgi:hypothetical protein